MKKILMLLGLFGFLFSEDLYLGIGPYFQTQPYKGAKPLYVPSPVIFFDNGYVYARWSRFGAYFYGKKGKEISWAFSVTAQPRPNGYKPGDSKELNGLDEKKTSLEAGLAYSIFDKKKNSIKYFEFMALTDVLGRYDSYILKGEGGIVLKYNKLSFTPSFVFVYESQKFTNYYYGISNEEAARTSYNEYRGSGGVRFAIQAYLNYDITEKWSAFFNLRVDRLTNDAKNSPITDTAYMYSGLASILYKFEI